MENRNKCADISLEISAIRCEIRKEKERKKKKNRNSIEIQLKFNLN